MNEEARRFLDELRALGNGHPGLDGYHKTYGDLGMKRFWSGLREEVMRTAVSHMAERLGDPQSRLSECNSGEKSFQRDIVTSLEKVEKVRRTDWQEALIFYCLEQDAAWKLHQASLPPKEKETIAKALQIRRIR